ncbi:hypothetical protein ABT279_22690 [Amycolatopsis sp. NPDC000673]|uniref:hypothetical protein n=1 Tax=unclassified Amycolatopsis TaxID=2618356 RepID=UPI00332A00A4
MDDYAAMVRSADADCRASVRPGVLQGQPGRQNSVSDYVGEDAIFGMNSFDCGVFIRCWLPCRVNRLSVPESGVGRPRVLLGCSRFLPMLQGKGIGEDVNGEV